MRNELNEFSSYTFIKPEITKNRNDNLQNFIKNKNLVTNKMAKN
jgi:hypothetical protein